MNKTLRIARRMEGIQPFYVMQLLARARELEARGRSIVHMEIGEPDFVTPEPIIRAGQEALASGLTHYTPALGLPALRRAVAEHYEAQFGVTVDPARVIITPGSSGALQLMMNVLVNPGEAVLLADPGYPCNRHFVQLVGGEPRAVAVSAETGYQLSADRVAAAWSPEVRAVMAASPSNPTGTLLSPDALQRLYEVVAERRGGLIMDEIYQGLTYGGSSHTALAVADEIFVINSFSKFFGMTGWRLGWAVVPESCVDAMDRLAQNLFLAPPTLSQHAALKAFSPDTLAILEERREAFRARRDYLLPALTELGFRFSVKPEGAFYLYGDCSGLTDDSFRFARTLLEEAGVAVTPGRDFGRNAPESHIRFAYTTDLTRLKEGVRRIGEFLARRAG